MIGKASQVLDICSPMRSGHDTQWSHLLRQLAKFLN